MTLVIALVLAVFGILGFVSSYTVGWLAHSLLAVAIALTFGRAIYGQSRSS